MGAIVANGTNTTVHDCSALNMTMSIVNPTGDVYVGELVDKLDGGSIGSDNGINSNPATMSLIAGITIMADTGTADRNAYAGGVVGHVSNAQVSGVNLSDNDGGVSVKAVPQNGGATYAGGVAGYAESANITDFVKVVLDGVTVTAETWGNSDEAYAGGAVGASVNTTYQDVIVKSDTTGYSNEVTANANRGNSTKHYAGGLVASSSDDIIRDVQIIKSGTGDFTITAEKGSAGGFAAKTNGSKFYKSFVRDVKVGGKDYVSLITKAEDTQMYGCYAQGVGGTSSAPTHAFNTISGSDSEYVGCYSTTANWAQTGSDMADTYFNCYYAGGTDTPAPGDTVKGVVATALQGTSTVEAAGTALAAMNNELMKTEGDSTNTNNSSFDWSEYGSPIMYETDSGTSVNNGYFRHGEMKHLIVTVSKGGDYLAEDVENQDGDWITVTPAANVFGSDGNYWVIKNTNVTITLTAADGVTVSKVEYSTDNTNYSKTSPAGTLNVTTGTITTDTVVDFKITPTKYYQYEVKLLSDGTGSYKTNGTSVTRSLATSTVKKQSRNSTTAEWADVNGTGAGAGKIHNVILTATNGTLTVPATLPEGWALVKITNSTTNANDKNYRQYTIEKTDGSGATAAEVEKFLDGCSLTAKASKSNTPVKAEANLLISEWAPYGALSGKFYNGHYYSLGDAATWTVADQTVRNQRSLLGGMSGSLAIINDSDENSHVAKFAGGQAWIGLNDANKEGTFVWSVPTGYCGKTTETDIITLEETGFTSWKSGEPNNSGSNENYVATNYGGEGLWNDFSGTQSLSYVKEYGCVTTSNAQGGSDAYLLTLNYQGSTVIDPDPDPNLPTDDDDDDSGSGGSGSSGTTNTGITEPAAPSATGVNRLLNCVDHGMYLQGYEDGAFRPDRNMTRGQVAMMFYRLLLNKNVTSTQSFSDVSSDYWCAEEIGVLSTLGIVTGYSDGAFRPDQPITRAQFATIVNNMLGRSADEDYVDDNRSELNTFSDVPASYWAYYDIMETANLHDYSKSGSHESWKS